MNSYHRRGGYRGLKSAQALGEALARHPCRVHDLLLLAPFVLLGAYLQSSLGLGAGLIIIPPAILLVGAERAVFASTVLALVLTSMIVWEARGTATRRELRVLRPLLVAALPAQVIGALLLASLALDAVQLFAAVFLFIAAVSQIPEIDRSGREAQPAGLVGVGLGAGLGSTLFGINGPVLAPYLLYLGFEGAELRHLLSRLLMGMGAIALPLLLVLVEGAREDAWLALPLILPLLVGHWFGRRHFHRLSTLVHRRAVAGIAAVGALALIVPLAG